MYCGNIWQVLIMSMEYPKELFNNVTRVFFVVQKDFLKDVKCFENDFLIENFYVHIYIIMQHLLGHKN